MSAPESPYHPADPANSAPVVAPPAAVDERLIDSPGRPTLVILGAVCLATLVMWSAGRAACNYHVPGESLTPRAVALEERAVGPKDTALEFAQQLTQGDFAVARKLAQGQALTFIDNAAQACPGECSAKKKLAPELATLAEVLTFNPADSYVRTRSVTPAGTESEHLLEVERTAQGWAVTSVLPVHTPLPQLKEAPPQLQPAGPGAGIPPSLRAVP